MLGRTAREARSRGGVILMDLGNDVHFDRAVARRNRFRITTLLATLSFSVGRLLPQRSDPAPSSYD